MTVRNKLAALAVATVLAVIGGSAVNAAYAVETPTDATVAVQSTDTNVTSQPEGDVVIDNAGDTGTTDTVDTSSSPEEAPTKAAEPELVVVPSPDPTIVADTNSAPAPVEAASAQVQQVVENTNADNPAIPRGTPWVVTSNQVVDNTVPNQLTVKFDYVKDPRLGDQPADVEIAVVAPNDRLVGYKRVIVEGSGRHTEVFTNLDPAVVVVQLVVNHECNCDGADPRVVFETNAEVKGGTSPTPTPTPTSTPKPTVTPTPGPTATVTPTPTPKPTASPSPTPTATPKPTPTSSPKPTVSPTPQPSVTPTATPTQEPTVSPTPQPNPSDTGSLIPTGGQPGSGASNSYKSGSIKYHSGKSQDDNKKTLAVTGQEDLTQPALWASLVAIVGLVFSVTAIIRRRRNSTS